MAPASKQLAIVAMRHLLVELFVGLTKQIVVFIIAGLRFCRRIRRVHAKNKKTKRKHSLRWQPCSPIHTHTEILSYGNMVVSLAHTGGTQYFLLCSPAAYADQRKII